MPSSSAEASVYGHTALSFEDLYQAHITCRRRKRNTASALRFELDLEHELVSLYEELQSGAYRPGPSICFVVKHPKPREIWASEYRDRVVQQYIYDIIGPRFERGFIADSCACIKGRGTLYAIERLDRHVRSQTQNWSIPAWYLKCDLQNFFVSIEKARLWALLEPRIPEPWLRHLAHTILFHDPRENYEFRGNPQDLQLVPTYKRLTCQPSTHGLPIGNLASQLGANILLNVLDQHVKHYIRARRYVRYVDDFVILGRSPQWLNAVLHDIGMFLPAELGLRLNDKKTILQPVPRGIDFVGQVIKPWHRRLRSRTVDYAEREIETAEPSKLMAMTNSYLGLCRQATKSHGDRIRLCRAVRRRGHAVNGELTKAYRSTAA